mmetsp:Transcript_81303/g.263728  ORF Transcript_81303/g.263728 Transcript_81303/m.263728 type:complete len:220 (-) Transcript_81303:206-865(-)
MYCHHMLRQLLGSMQLSERRDVLVHVVLLLHALRGLRSDSTCWLGPHDCDCRNQFARRPGQSRDPGPALGSRSPKHSLGRRVVALYGGNSDRVVVRDRRRLAGFQGLLRAGRVADRRRPHGRRRRLGSGRKRRRRSRPQRPVGPSWRRRRRRRGSTAAVVAAAATAVCGRPGPATRGLPGLPGAGPATWRLTLAERGFVEGTLTAFREFTARAIEGRAA